MEDVPRTDMYYVEESIKRNTKKLFIELIDGKTSSAKSDAATTAVATSNPWLDGQQNESVGRIVARRDGI